DYFNSQGSYDPQYSLLPAIKKAVAGESSAPTWLNAAPEASYNLSGNTLVVSGGSVTFTEDASSTLPNLTVSVATGASLLLSASQDIASLIVSGGVVIFAGGGNSSNISASALPLATPDASSTSDVLLLNSLTTTNGGQLDLGDGELDIEYGGNPTPADAIASQIASGYANGQWDGNGIISSTAASDLTHATGIGYFDDGTEVKIARTWYGDANLDGQINADDISLMMFGQAMHSGSWQEGNFNYDSQVNADDWMKMFYGIAVSSGQKLATFAADVANDSSATEGFVVARPANVVAPAFAQVPIGADQEINNLLDPPQPLI
ncbi:MAG TPA: hypothetical protein VG722_04815, partial [Tepidisphaeraceae bacterium]|nr:hypothetical protein [Tepidisphaeraceae bacterium]